MRKIISVVIVFCFLLSSVSFAIEAYPNKACPVGMKLAVPSKIDDLKGIEAKDIGDIELWFRGVLASMAKDKTEISIDTLKKFAHLPGNTIFHPKGTQFFIEEATEIEGNRLRVMVRRKDDTYGLRTYYAEFSKPNDIVVYPKEKSKERTSKDTKAKARYANINQAIIDKAIRERIDAGDFAEIEGRAEALGWDKKYPDRKKPKTYWNLNLLVLIQSKLNPFLKELGTSIEKAFQGKNIVFIRTPKGGFPVINEDGYNIIVDSHISANAAYFFLSKQTFDDYTRNPHKGRDVEAPADTPQKKLVEYLTRDPLLIEIANSYGLTYEVKGSKEHAFIRNDLYKAYWNYRGQDNIEDIRKKYPELEKLKGEPVDLNLNLPDRDYAAAKEDIKEEDLRSSISDFLMGLELIGKLETLLPKFSDIDTLQRALSYTSTQDAKILYIATDSDFRREVIKRAKKVGSIVMERARQLTKEEIHSMVPLAGSDDIVKEIPTHPDKQYTLLLTSEFYANGELETHKTLFEERVKLGAVSGQTADEFIGNVIDNPNTIKDRTIVLLPDELPEGKFEEKHYQRLKDAGIRFIITSRKALLDARAKKDIYRKKFQKDTYATMILIRRLDNKIEEGSAIHRLLSFFIKSHFNLKDISVQDYIQAIITGNIANLIKGYLKYRPAGPYDVPDYEDVAATLISA